MMKVAVFFALIAASFAASVPPRAVDWTAVGAKIGEIESAVVAAVQQVKNIANNDNEQVGGSISDQIDAAAVGALAILQQANDAVSNATLTEDGARELLGQLREILTKLQGDLQDELDELSEAAATQIREVFYGTLTSVEAKAQELYALLSARTRAVDWSAVGAKVGEIETLVRGAVQQIKSIANNDNEQVGGSISDQLDAAAVQATAILQQAAAAIADQSLTEEKAKELLGQLKDILLGLQTDLQDELAQLSEAAATQIRELFYATLASAEQKAQELYALLRAVLSTRAVDWSAVGAKVGEIETLVRGAVQQIKSIANNDNEQVGGSISDQLDAAAVQATAILQQAAAAIADQSLTEEKAKELLGQLKDILLGLQTDLQDELAQLSEAAATQIRELFYATLASAEQKAQELYALLRA